MNNTDYMTDETTLLTRSFNNGNNTDETTTVERGGETASFESTDCKRIFKGQFFALSSIFALCLFGGGMMKYNMHADGNTPGENLAPLKTGLGEYNVKEEDMYVVSELGEIYGKSHHSKKEYSYSSCLEDKHYSKKTAKTAFELPFAALFKDVKGEKKFEASSLIKVNDAYYSICDNSWAISKFDASLTPFSTSNVQIGDPDRETEDSGYEALVHHNNTFFVVRESVEHMNTISDSSSYHAIIEELVITDDGLDYQIIDQCKCEYEFEGDSKGFEGAFGMLGLDGEFYMIGLCEGNHCSEGRKFDAGNGRLILMKKNAANVNDDCIWKTVKKIDIPESANFRDYSDIEVTSTGKVIVTTQEDSAFWIGQLNGINDGVLDPDGIVFDADEYKIYEFPKSNECFPVYCNVEGVTFINDQMIMAVSDKMKSKGKQPFWCLEKDQSIHAFVLP